MKLQNDDIDRKAFSRCHVFLYSVCQLASASIEQIELVKLRTNANHYAVARHLDAISVRKSGEFKVFNLNFINLSD